MQRIDDKPQEQWVKCLVYGQPGTGKTSFGVTAPEPLFLLSERQAVVNIRAAAKRLGLGIPRTILIENAEDYRNVIRALRLVEAARKQTAEATDPGGVADFVVNDASGKELLRFDGWLPQTVIVDSITDAQKLLSDEINLQSPQKIGKDGLPVAAERYWGVLIDRAEKLIRSFRDLPMHVIFLALLDDRTEGEGNDAERIVQPSCAAKRIGPMLAAAVSVVGVTFRQQIAGQLDEQKQQRYRYAVLTSGPQYMLLKPYRPLRDIEQPDFRRWVHAVQTGELVEDATASAPAKEEAAQAAVEAPAENVGNEPNSGTRRQRRVRPEAQKEGAA